MGFVAKKPLGENLVQTKQQLYQYLVEQWNAIDQKELDYLI